MSVLDRLEALKKQGNGWGRNEKDSQNQAADLRASEKKSVMDRLDALKKQGNSWGGYERAAGYPAATTQDTLTSGTGTTSPVKGEEGSVETSTAALGKSDIEQRMKQAGATMQTANQRITGYSRAGNMGKALEEEREKLKMAQAEYNSLKQQLALLEQNEALAKRAQEFAKGNEAYNALIQQDDFKAYSSAGATKDNSGSIPGNIVHYYRENEHPLYSAMTEQEVSIYDYLLGKGDNEGAQKYLEFLNEDLRRREGEAKAQEIQDIENPVKRTLATGAHAFKAGVDNAVQGTVQFFRDEEMPTSATQFASAALMEDMGTWGRYAYSAVNTVGNMLPSIVVGTLTGGAGGAAAMGLSSSGNAYKQALNEGYDKGDARVYSVLVGASEAALQYAIGGISKLGGVADDVLLAKAAKLDKAYKRMIATGAIKLGSEITEEEVQLFLEPAIKSIIMDVPYDAPNFEEMVETAIVTALSTGTLEGGNILAAGVNKPVQNGQTENAASGAETASKYDAAQAAEIQHEGKTFRNLVAGVDTKVSEFFDRWRSGRKSHQGEKLEKLYMGKMPLGVKAKVADLLGYEVDERDFIVTNDDVKHVFDHHGDPEHEIEAGNIPLEPWMFDALPDVLVNPDSITPGHVGESRKNSGKRGVLFSKAFPGGTVITVQYDNPGRKTMGTATIYAKNKGATSELYAPVETDTSAVRPGRSEPAPIVNTNIPQPANSVNSGTVQGFGENGTRVITEIAENSGMTMQKAQEKVRLAYQTGQSNLPGTQLDLTDIDQRRAYNAGKMDFLTADRSGGKDLVNGQETRYTETEGAQSNEEVHLRGSGQRADGTHSSGAISAVESRTGGDQSGKEQDGPAAGQTAGLTYGEKVSPASQGIAGGSTVASIRLVTGGENVFTRAAKRLAKKFGLRVVFFSGNNLDITRWVTQEDGTRKKVNISARAYIAGDRVFIRVDHPRFTADQIMRHEVGHYMIDKGDINPDTVRERIDRKFGPEKAQLLADMYVEAYKGSGLKPEEIWVEIICDSLGDMNEFAGKSSESAAALLLEKTKVAAQESIAEAKQTRGPPPHVTDINVEGKMSMDVFPPYDISKSDANEHATRWAHQADVKDGDQKIVPYHGDWYTIEADSSADLRYRIISKMPNEKYQNYRRAKRNGNRSGVSRSSNRLSEFDRDGDWTGGRGLGSASTSIGQQGENLEVQPMDTESTERRNVTSDRGGNLPGGRAGIEGNEPRGVNARNVVSDETKAFLEKRDAAKRLQQLNKKMRKRGLTAKEKNERADIKARYNFSLELEQEKVERAAERYKKALDKVRADRDAKLKKLKAEHRAKEAVGRERRKARELRQKIERHASELSRKLLRPNDKKHIPQALQGPVARLLEAVNLESQYTIDPENGKRQKTPEGLPNKRTKAFAELKAAYAEIKGELVVDPDLLGEDGAVGLLDEVLAMADTPIASMNSEQLTTLWKAIRAVEASITSTNKLFKASRFKTVGELAQEIRSSAMSKQTKANYGGKGVGKITGWLDGMMNVQMMDSLTFLHQFGKGGDALYRILQGARDQRTTILKRVTELTSTATEGADVKALQRQKRTFTTENGDTLTMTTAQLMSLYELNKRRQARDHIYKGGIRTTEQETKASRGKTAKENFAASLGKLDVSAESIHVTQEDVQKMLSALTPEQIKVADALQAIMETYLADEGNKASMAVFGYEKFNEENYFPITADPHQTQNKIGDKLDGYDRPRSIAEWGSAKGTVRHANNGLLLGDIFDVFAQHAVDMATYASHLEAIEDLNRVRNFQFYDERGNKIGTMSDIIQRVAGRQGNAYFDKLLQDISSGTAKGRDGISFSKLTANYKAASVGMNMRVALQQPTSYLRAAAVIDPKYLLQAIGKTGGWEKALKYAPIAQWKEWGNFEINQGRQLQDIMFGTDSKLDKARENSMWLAAKMDSITWGAIWNACELELAQTQSELRKGSEEFYQAVAERFTDVIDQTQVVDNVLGRSQIMRRNGELSQMVTSFLGESTKQYNMLYRAFTDWNREQDNAKRSAALKVLGVTVTSYVAANFMNAVAQSLWDAVRDDDDREEKYWERFMSHVLPNFFDNINPLGGIPYVKDVWSTLQGYEVKRMDMQAITGLISALQGVEKALRGEGRYTVVGSMANLLAEFGRIVGLPVATVKRDLMAIARNFAVEIGDWQIQYYIERAFNSLGSTYNRGEFYDILFGALKDGDLDAYKQISRDMVEHGVKPTAIENAMRSRYKDAVTADSSFAMDEKARDLIGSRNHYGQEGAADEEGFTAEDLSGTAYQKYTSQRAENYRKMEDGLKSSRVFRALSDSNKDKALDYAWNLADKTALEDASRGQYEVTAKWMTLADDVERAGVDPADYILFHLAYEMTSGSDKQDKVRDWLEEHSGLTETEREALWKTVYLSRW